MLWWHPWPRVPAWLPVAAGIEHHRWVVCVCVFAHGRCFLMGDQWLPVPGYAEVRNGRSRQPCGPARCLPALARSLRPFVGTGVLSSVACLPAPSPLLQIYANNTCILGDAGDSCVQLSGPPDQFPSPEVFYTQVPPLLCSRCPMLTHCGVALCPLCVRSCTACEPRPATTWPSWVHLGCIVGVQPAAPCRAPCGSLSCRWAHSRQ